MKKQTIGVLLLMIFFASSIAFVEPVAATPGVGGAPPDVYTLGNDLETRAVQYGSDTYYYGVYTTTGLSYDLFLDGPNVNTLHLNLFNKDYVKSNDLTVQKIVAWRPIFLIESESWYSHTLEYASSVSTKTTTEFTTEIDIGDGSDGVTLEEGGTQTTSSTSAYGWSVTASGGDTKVVYVRMVFLRVTGSITYNKYLGFFIWSQVTYDYDVTVLENVDMSNIVTVTNPSSDLPMTDTELFEVEGTTLVKHYGLGDAWYSYSEVSEISDYFALSLNYAGATFSGSVEITSSTSTSVKHHFVGDFPSSYEYFYYIVDNYFSLNIVSIYDGGGGGGGPVIM